MTHGRQLGSTTTIVRPARRATTASIAAASGSSTRPNVPTCRAATLQRQRRQRRGRRQAGRRRARGVEGVRGRAVVVQARQRQGRRVVRAQRRGQVDAVGEQHALVGHAEAIRRQATEVRDRLAQAADRARRVEGAAAGVALDAAVGVRDEVVERLAADEDRGAGHAAARLGPQLAGAADDERPGRARPPALGPSKPSSRANSSSAARRPRRRRILRQHRQPRGDDVAEHDIVEADERDGPLPGRASGSPARHRS